MENQEIVNQMDNNKVEDKGGEPVQTEQRQPDDMSEKNEKKRNIVIASVTGGVMLLVLAIALALNFTGNGDSVSDNTSNGQSSSIDAGDTASNSGSATINTAGTYRYSGTQDPITINTSGDVVLVFDSVSITSNSGPAIYVADADSVTIVLNGENTITAKNTTDDLEGAIHSTDDLIFEGDGSLTVNANLDGIVSKDTLTIKSGTYTVNSGDDCIKGKDSVEISGGTFNLVSSAGDGIKSTNKDGAKLGYVYITGGKFNIKVADDGIHAITKLTIDDGDLTINAHEALEATYVTINGGTIDITASDDGINAAAKSSAYTPTIEINGGTVTISMGQGDTDAIDSNGNIKVTGGNINITAQFAFDFDGTATYIGGTIVVNGETISSITNSMMMGPGAQGQQPQQGQQGQAAPQGQRMQYRR